LLGSPQNLAAAAGIFPGPGGQFLVFLSTTRPSLRLGFPQRATFGPCPVLLRKWTTILSEQPARTRPAYFYVRYTWEGRKAISTSLSLDGISFSNPRVFLSSIPPNHCTNFSNHEPGPCVPAFFFFPGNPVGRPSGPGHGGCKAPGTFFCSDPKLGLASRAWAVPFLPGSDGTPQGPVNPLVQGRVKLPRMFRFGRYAR